MAAAATTTKTTKTSLDDDDDDDGDKMVKNENQILTKTNKQKLIIIYVKLSIVQ